MGAHEHRRQPDQRAAARRLQDGGDPPRAHHLHGQRLPTLYAPLIRDGRMEKFYWNPSREDRIGVATGIFREDNVGDAGIERLGKRLVNSKDGDVSFETPNMSLENLLEYGNLLVGEQENVKRVQLADSYLDGAELAG